jgi:spoIIIJ-associated protein
VEEVERSAASVEEAIEAALNDLGASEQEVEVEVLQEPKSGFLGLGSQAAMVRVRRRLAPESISDAELDEQAEIAAEFLEGLFDRMGLDIEVEPNLTGETMYVDLWGAESDQGMGLLIGRRGATLDALQELARAVVQGRVDERARIVVDVEDYRKRRRDQLIARAQSAARRVKRTGRPESLESMTAFERKIVHDAVSTISGTETSSEGEEPNRRVVIRRVRSRERST